MIAMMAFVKLARVSNLPTIWSNVIAAWVLAGGVSPSSLAVILVAMSSLYTGGMILNDVFDREIDARERPERPLPSGAVAPQMAIAAGGGFLFAGVLLLSRFGIESTIAAVALAGCILIYDAWHKGNPASPLVMGMCRALVYVGTALAAGSILSAPILGAALALLLYVVALTYLAKRDAAPIGLLIAAIALLDAAVAIGAGHPVAAAICVGCFGLTLALQRAVPGT